MKQILFFSLGLLVFSCNNHQGEKSNGTVYLRTSFQSDPNGGSLDISWIYMGDDGTIVWNPQHGLDPVNIDAEKNDNAKNVGTYKIEGKNLKITWADGRTTNWGIEKKDGALTGIDSGPVFSPEKFPSNSHIHGRFAAGSFSSKYSGVQTMVFKNDGTFALTNSTAEMGDDFDTYGENTRKGKYELSGNTLRINFDDGTKQISNITTWDQGDGKTALVINKSSYPQEK